MAFHHHPHPTPTTTTTTCYCQTSPYPHHPPPPPPLSLTTSCHCQTNPYHHNPPLQQPSLSTDPLVVATLVTQLLQTQTQTPQNPLLFKSKQRYPHHETQPFQQYSQQPHSLLLSLLQRIDALETSLHRFSSSSFSVRDAAARTIQTHFRAFLAHRSRTLGQLKELSFIKSCVSSLKSSLSRHGFVDFDALSRKAMDLLHHLDSIQGGDQLIRDSKKSITKEIVQFLELVDGACVKRHQVLTKTMKNMRLVRNNNDNRTGHDCRVFSEQRVGVGSKGRNMSNNDKKVIANLRERFERIGRMSRALGNLDEGVELEGFEHLGADEDSDVIAQFTNNYRQKNGHGMHSNAKKQVSFMGDGNVIRVYDIDGEARSGSRSINEIEESSKGIRQDEEEAESYDGEDVFTAPEPVKMEGRADLMARKPGVKITG